MPLTLDHVVVAVHNLEHAIQDYRALGFTVLNGGVHANGATHNALIVFEDGTYIELLAKTGQPPKPELIDFSVLLNSGEGLVGYALSTDNIEADAARLKANDISIGEIVAGERRTPDGTLIQWKLLQIDPDGQAHGFAPFLIQDVTPRELRVPTDPTMTTHENRAVGIDAVDIVVRSSKKSRKRYQAIVGTPRTYSDQRFELAVGGILINEAYPPTYSTWEEHQRVLYPNRMQRSADELAASEWLRRWEQFDQQSRQRWEQQHEFELTRMEAVQNRTEALVGSPGTELEFAL